MDLQPGYSLPEGKCIRLFKSLYRLLQASSLFHASLEEWLLSYGFKPAGADCVIFHFDRGTEKMILSLYVDD
eukprot:212422-Rhodomonas_salina.2